jgi:hypothetical protein
MELDLTGVEKLLNPNTPKTPPANDPELDLSGVDKILSPHKKSGTNDDRIVFQPETSDWNTNRLSSIRDFYSSIIGKELPVKNVGQGEIHNKWKLDHRNSVDIGVHPDSKEGQKLQEYLRENNIPFLAFKKAIPGVSTSAHIHIGRPSSRTEEKFDVGTTGELPQEELNLEGVQELIGADVPEQQLDLSGVEDIVSGVEGEFALDPNQLDFKVGATEVSGLLNLVNEGNRPVITGNDPFQAGELIETKFYSETSPNTNLGIDNLLTAWNPDYADLNDRFRTETGGLNLINVAQQEGFIQDLGGGNYKVKARPTRGAVALIEAYKKGGLPAYNATLNVINKQQDKVLAENRKALDNIEAVRKAHPYISSIQSGFQQEAQSDIQLVNNIKYLGKAFAIGTTKGWDSEDYLNLINQEAAEQEQLNAFQTGMYNPPSFAGKVLTGGVAGAAMLPKVTLVGASTGAVGLPLMVYLENLHRGNREAAISALPMALLAGSGRGLGRFTDVDPAGSSAPFRRISKQDLSLMQDTIVKGESVSIAQLTPLERQLIHRGANALTLQIPTEDQDWRDVAANLIVGLSLPVGKSPKEFKFAEPLRPIETVSPVIEATVPEIKARIPVQLEQERIEVPITAPTRLGKFPVVEQGRDIPPVIYPSAESPNVRKYGEPFDPTIFPAQTETGFQAKTSGQNVHLDLDTANLNLLDLRRSLEEQTYSAKGDTLQDSLSKQQAIKNAIAVLEQAIPPETREFFEKNEEAIRAALRTNWESRNAKQEIKTRLTQTPNEIKPTEPEAPVIVTGEETTSELFAGKAGDLNNFTSQEKAHDILQNFFKITSQGQQSTILPYGDVIARKSADIAYLSAFYIEDFYHRGIVPTVDLVLNKLRTSISDFGRYISEDQAKKSFEEGMKFYESNVADPFFSKLKQDVAEKLPNRMDVQQARNIINGHSNEAEWTVGLEEFLKEREGKKIGKRELIDVIQKGQVRVEESVAQENPDIGSREWVVQNRLSQIESRFKELDNYLEPKTTEQITRDNIEWNKLLDEQHKLFEERNDIKTSKPRYSLSQYRHEKLELPGAINSKEVKLITPIVTETDPIALAMEDKIDPTILGREKQIKYKSPHWDEPNVVAHYRSNDRITTDGKRTYFSEEFQSDWMHDIREKGVKLKDEDLAKFEARGVQLREAYDKATNSEELTAISRELNHWRRERNSRNNRVEPNPFMGHLWKELVMKRFIRDGVVAKDENGNYKYEGLGWTTARQQKERYGKILEGKNFKWQKNSDGTYTFELGNFVDEITQEGLQWQQPHELRNISLERFAELTTKEAADHVRQQESEYAPEEFRQERPSGKFSLKEAVELRSGIGKYSDYDVAMVNIAKKIGKRFGANYSEKEINTGKGVGEGWLSGEELIQRGIISREKWNVITESERAKLFDDFRRSVSTINEKVHFLEITPSMRESLTKEGLPLYGTGASEPLKSSEVGIRNRVTTTQGFDEHRDSLVKSLESLADTKPNWSYENLSPEVVREGQEIILNADKETVDQLRNQIKSRDNIFNSGLSPDAFIDQAKLLYKGFTEFSEFSTELIKRFGEQVKPFLQDLWIQVKGLAKKFHEDERGFLNLQLRRLQTDAEKRYRESKPSRLEKFGSYAIHRGVMLAQIDPKAGVVYDVARLGQRDKNYFEFNVLKNLRKANTLVKAGTDQAVADNIFIGNENQKLFTPAELAAGDPATGRPSLNPDQIAAYNAAYAAEHLNLDKRKQHVLFSYRQRADRLNNQLMAQTTGTPEWTNIANKLLDLRQVMDRISDHYDYLKTSGYISLKRKGPIAAFVQDPAFPAGDKRGQLYRQFETLKDAGVWVAEQQRLLGADEKLSEIYDINIPQRLRAAAAKLTPAQFEDLVDAAGVNSRAKEIEDLRDEIYTRYPSTGYELKRDYVRGYERNWQFVLESIADQTEAYANSFYSRVAGEHMIKALEATGLQTTNKELYQTMQKYVDHEISSPERGGLAAIAGYTRKGVYLFQLGFDANQLYLNAIAQPISQTYSYFSRVEHNGIRLKGFEPEKYFRKGARLAAQVAKDFVTGSSTADPEFQKIRERLTQEGVITPEFNKSLLDLEVEKTVGSKLKRKTILNQTEHWAGAFMRAGEKTTRTHVAAEAFLVGRDKFGLAGEDLVTFMVRAIDATQTNPSRAEAPLLVRGKQNQAEIRKLLYQFNAFSHMWMENLALNVRADFRARRISATARHLGAITVMGGLKALPLSGVMAGLYTLITNKDPAEDLHKVMNNETLERMALYGVTGHATISNKVSAEVPFVEDIGGELFSSDKSIPEIFSLSRIPAFSTAGQITKGFNDIRRGDAYRGLGQVLPIKPLRNIATAIRYNEEGIRTRGGRTIVPRSQVKARHKFLQIIPGINPAPLSEYYEKQGDKKRTDTVKRLRKILK